MDKRLAGPEPEVIYRPRGYVDIYLDTVHGYGKSDGFGGLHYDEGYGGPHDLHAWLVREMASYFTAQGVGYWRQHEVHRRVVQYPREAVDPGDPELGGRTGSAASGECAMTDLDPSSPDDLWAISDRLDAIVANPASVHGYSLAPARCCGRHPIRGRLHRDDRCP